MKARSEKKEVRSKERPILFSTDMVKAIMEGRKTLTRRVMNPQPISQDIEMTLEEDRPVMKYGETGKRIAPVAPYGWKGDLLWVRETWCVTQPADPETYHYGYKAGGVVPYSSWEVDEKYYYLSPDIYKPSIHMPKDAARIWLEVTDIRVERLQDISEDDAIEEGIEPDVTGLSLKIENGIEREVMEYYNYSKEGYRYVPPIDSFRSLWDSINSKITWNDNPWVWVVSFKVLSTTGKPNQFQELEKEYRNGC